MAATAPAVAWMCWTFLSCSCTWLLSPPARGCTPRHDGPRFKNGSKSTAGSCLNVLNVSQLILHLAAVSASSWITPGHNSPRSKNGSKSTKSCLDVLDVSQLLLHLAAVSATPGHNRPRFRNGSKSSLSCLDVLNVSQLLLHLAAVSASSWITSGDTGPSCKNGSNSTCSCLEVLDVSQQRLHLAAVSATVWFTPRHNLAPGAKRNQANALPVAASWPSERTTASASPSGNPALSMAFKSSCRPFAVSFRRRWKFCAAACTSLMGLFGETSTE